MSNQRYEILPPKEDDTRYEVLPSKKEEKSKQFYDDTIIGELGEGIASGVVGIAEGIAGLGTTLYDVIADTNHTDKVTASAEAVRSSLGLDPEGFVGKGAEIITQFVAPGVGVAAKVGKVAKAARAAAGKTGPLSKGERFSQAVKETAAVLGTEVAVSPDGTSTVIGDVFGFDPTKTNDLIGLEGREKALARIGNRIKIGVEAGGIGAGVQGILSGTGYTAGMLAKTPQAQKVAGSISDKLNNTADYIDGILYKKMIDPDSLSKFESTIAPAVAFSRYRGFLPQQVALDRLLLDGKVQQKLKQADFNLKNLDSSIQKTLSDLPPGSPLTEVDLLNRIHNYLTEVDPTKKSRLLEQLPKGVKENSVKMREHVDSLSNKVLDTNFLKRKKFFTPDGESVEDIISRNVGSYLRRQYKIFTDKKYVPTEQQLKDADDFFKTNKTFLENELTKMARTDVDNVINEDFLRRNRLKRVGAGDEQKIVFKNLEGLRTPQVTDEAAKLARENFLNGKTLKSQDYKSGRVARDKLDTGILLDRQEIPATLRSLMGEIKDPREAYLSTVADLSQFVAVDKYYENIKKLSELSPELSKIFRNGNNLTNAQKQGLRNSGFRELGGENGESSLLKVLGKEGDPDQKVIGRSGWGSLDGFFVPNEIYKDLTRHVIGEESAGAKVLRGLFSTFLRGKALSQYSKTILSPITQIRNFTTATAFALANGNIPTIGRGGDLNDARKIVFANIFDKGDDAVMKDLIEAQELGILGTNAELREIQDSLRTGGFNYAEESRDGMTAMLGKTIADKVKKVTKPAEEFYQGSDDFWKYYNYKVESAKIKKNLEGLSVNQQINYLSKKGDLSPDMSTQIRRAKQEGFTPANTPQKLIDNLVKQRAAQIVRDTVPNYDKAASELVTLLRKFPLGNFIVFPMEIFRTSFNIMRQAADEMSSPIKSVRDRGTQRMLGLIGTTTVLPAAIPLLGYKLSGVSKEEMEAYQKYFAPEWEKGAILIPTGKDEEGKIKYINFSTSNPYDNLGRAAVRFFREFSEAKEQGKGPGQILTDVMYNSVKEYTEPFLSEGMLTEALLDVTIRQGKTSTGAEVYDPQDSVGDKAGKIIAHVANTTLPNLLPVDLNNVLSPKDFAEPKRFIRGTVGAIAPNIVDPKTKIGRETSGLEILSSIGGVSTQEFNPKKGLEFAAFRMQRAQNNARSQFNTLTDDANISSRSLYDGFVKANEAKLRVDKEYYQIIKSLQTMGMKKGELRRILKNNKIGGVNSILRGKFEPFKITDNNLRELRENNKLKELPRQEINNLRKSLNGMPLDPREEDFRVKEQRKPTGPRYEILPPKQPRYEILPPKQTNLPTPTPTPTTASTTNLNISPGPVDPNLLGTDPGTIAIAQKLGRV